MPTTTLAAPTLNNIAWLANQILAFWMPATGSGNYYLIGLFANNATTPQQTARAFGISGQLPSPNVSDNATTYAIAVAETDSSYQQVGPWSNAIGVVTNAPTQVRVAYDGTVINVSWTVPAGATVSKGGSIQLYANGQLVSSQAVPGNTGAYVPASALNPAVAYTVTVAGEIPNSIGPYSTAIAVVQATTDILALDYLGTSLLGRTDNLTFTPALFLYGDDRLRKQTTGTSGLVTMPLDAPLEPWIAYTARMAMALDATGSSIGPLSAPMPVMVAPPTISRVGFNGAAVDVTWVNAPATPVPTGGNIALYKDNVFVVANSVLGTQGTLTPSQALEPDKSYTVAVLPTRGPSVGSPSATLPVVVATQAIASVAFDGAVITVTWTDTNGPNVTGYLLELTSHGVLVRSQAAAGGRGVIDMALDASGVYAVSLRPMAGTQSSGQASGAVAVIAAAPVITNVLYDGTTLTVVWKYTPVSWVTGFVVTIFTGTSETQRQPVTGGSAVQVQIPATLTAGVDYHVIVQATGASTTGPASEPEPIVVGVPTITSAFYDSTDLSLTWSAVVGRGVSGYQVTVFVIPNLQQPPVVVTTVKSALLSSKFPITIPGGQLYTATVQALSTVSSGPLSAQLELMVWMPPFQAVYDGKTLAVTPGWTGSGYVITVWTAGRDEIARQYLTGPVTTPIGTANLDVEMSPNAAYSVSVQYATAGRVGHVGGGQTSLGPYSSAPLLTAAPLVTSVTCAGTAVTVKWAFTGVGPVTGYNAYLYDNETQIATQSVTSDKTEATFTGLTLDASRPYTVRVQAQNVFHNDNNPGGGTNTIISPLSAPQPVIPAAPALADAAFDGTNVTLHWQAVAGAGVTGYQAVITRTDTNAVVASAKTAATQATLPLAPESGIQYTANVQAIGVIASGPVSASPAITLGSPTLTATAYNQGVVTAQWNAPQNITPSAYRVTITSGGAPTPIASAAVTGTSATVAVPAGSTPAIQVAAIVTSNGVPSSGPPTAAIAMPSAVATVSTVVTDAISGSTTVTWTALDGITKYKVQTYVNGVPSGQPATVDTNSMVLPSPLSPTADTAIAIAAVGAAANVDVHGPYSEPFRLFAAQPALQSVEYDAMAVTSRWTPVDGATAYILSVIATSNGTHTLVTQTTVPATATSATLPVALTDTSKTYTAVVQASRDGNTGPASASQPVFTPAWFVSSQPATTSAPHLMPASTLALGTASDILVYLPPLAASALQNLPIQGPITLDNNTNSTSKAAFPYTLSIAASSAAWTFDTQPIRGTLQTAYVDLLKSAEVSGASPAGIALLQAVISRVMPQTFVETLYYAYGLQLGVAGGWADLRPGLVLRVVFNDFLNTGTAAPPLLNGYVGSVPLDYDVGSYFATNGGWLTGLDAFIAQLVASGTMQVTPPYSVPPGQGTPQTESGVADAADLFYPEFCAPFYRLFFPQTLSGPSTIGNVYPARNFAIAAAPSYQTLVNTVNYPTGANAVAYFRGRAVVTLCIRVTVNGVEEVVPIGTTVGNILDRYGARAPGTAVQVKDIRLERALGPAVFDPAASFGVGQSFRVRLDWGSLAAYGQGQDALTLPLLHGDRLWIGR